MLKFVALLTNCGAGIVIRIQVKLEPGRGASGHLAAEGHSITKTDPESDILENLIKTISIHLL